ncbi:MAG: 7-carboxy-7-deazaguanine synthase QueE [Thermoanaerobaculia bacterium]|nr:7-carboxy-7-deazaguanine synthase QueE [Thermoanaerobaculia bacterium]
MNRPPATTHRTVDAIRRLPVEERLKIHEIFYSIQGESTFAGRPCVLVRLTGCQMRCSWCDTEYAFYEGEWRSRAEVVQEVASFGCPLVELTGGEPLLQPAARPLMIDLCDAGFEVLIETGGGLDISGIDPRVHRIVDVKCPASGEARNNRWQNLDLLTSRDEVKLVIADRADYDWAKALIHRHDLASRCPVHLSPVHELAGTEGLEPVRLAQWILEDRLPVRLQLQVHKYIWDPATRGV